MGHRSPEELHELAQQVEWMEVFANQSLRARTEVLGLLHLQQVRAGHVIYEIGDEAKEGFVLFEGVVSLSSAETKADGAASTEHHEEPFSESDLQARHHCARSGQAAPLLAALRLPGAAKRSALELPARELARVEAGSSFGSPSSLNQAWCPKRQTAARAISHCVLGSLKLVDTFRLLQQLDDPEDECTKKLELLSTLPPFASWPRPLQLRLCPMLHRRKLRRHEVLYEAETESSMAFIASEGDFAVCKKLEPHASPPIPQRSLWCVVSVACAPALLGLSSGIKLGELHKDRVVCKSAFACVYVLPLQEMLVNMEPEVRWRLALGLRAKELRLSKRVDAQQNLMMPERRYSRAARLEAIRAAAQVPEEGDVAPPVLLLDQFQEPEDPAAALALLTGENGGNPPLSVRRRTSSTNSDVAPVAVKAKIASPPSPRAASPPPLSMRIVVPQQGPHGAQAQVALLKELEMPRPPAPPQTRPNQPPPLESLWSRRQGRFQPCDVSRSIYLIDGMPAVHSSPPTARREEKVFQEAGGADAAVHGVDLDPNVKRLLRHAHVLPSATPHRTARRAPPQYMYNADAMQSWQALFKNLTGGKLPASPALRTSMLNSLMPTMDQRIPVIAVIPPRNSIRRSSPRGSVSRAAKEITRKSTTETAKPSQADEEQLDKERMQQIDHLKEELKKSMVFNFPRLLGSQGVGAKDASLQGIEVEVGS